MKNNKRSPITLARQARFNEEFGILPGQTLKDALKPELEALAALSAELIGKDAPGVEDERNDFHRGQRYLRRDRGTSELTERETSEKYGTSYALANVGQDCNPELSETESALVRQVKIAGDRDTETIDNGN